MHELQLTGISGSKPIGAMAAFGLLRVVANERPFGNVRLSWRFASDWRPVLHTEQAICLESLIEFLIDRQPRRTDARFLQWNDDIKCMPEEFLDQLVQVTSEADEEACLFFAAYGCEAITAKSTPDVKPTAFHMTAGQQKFLKSARELSALLDPQNHSSRQSVEQQRTEIAQSWRETLIGPWTYQDKVHSLGWDPTTEALYALSDRSPSEVGARSVLGAVWLAFESLPLFPSVPGDEQLLTSGFDREGNNLTWPVWESPVSVDTLRHWLAAPDLAKDNSEPAAPYRRTASAHWPAVPDLAESNPKMKELHKRGISALFRARCTRDGNGRGTFRNAVQIT